MLNQLAEFSRGINPEKDDIETKKKNETKTGNKNKTDTENSNGNNNKKPKENTNNNKPKTKNSNSTSEKRGYWFHDLIEGSESRDEEAFDTKDMTPEVSKHFPSFIRASHSSI